jgi:hypothetical protein
MPSQHPGLHDAKPAPCKRSFHFLFFVAEFPFKHLMTFERRCVCVCVCVCLHTSLSVCSLSNLLFQQVDESNIADLVPRLVEMMKKGIGPGTKVR